MEPNETNTGKRPLACEPSILSVVAGSAPILCDEKGREILVGDVLKVFHFYGARRKKYWMYKQVTERTMLGKANPVPAYKLWHLDLRPASYYWEIIDGRHLAGVEIVQGYGTDSTHFEDRPKHSLPNAEVRHGEDNAQHSK